MKNILSTFFLVLFFFASLPLYASDRLVTTDSDESEEGTLRVILQDACDTAGDDTITFDSTSLSEIRINLKSPLVIPQDCQGSVTIEGSSEVDTLLDASSLTGGTDPGTLCTVDVYADNNTLKNFSIVNNSSGAGVCLFGRSNTLQQNRINTNKYGVVVSDAFKNEYSGMDGSSNIIGGTSFDTDKNIIQNNSAGGIFVLGSSATGVTITHNTISDNGNGMNIDLQGDGVTINDLSDEDEGPNHLLNFSDYFQGFPMVPATDGTERYWGWGVAMSGSHLELYQVSDLDLESGLSYGGGETWVGDLTMSNMTYQTDPTVLAFASGDVVTSLSFDDSNNTSEFSMNVNVGPDADMDGIVDNLETGNGSESSGGSSANNADSDGDGLPDSVEDRNRNGICDSGETCAYNPDTDGDGISDWYETGGDGIYDEGVDSNPFEADSDTDGIPDVTEDANQNGIWEAYLGETSPLLTDSDGDGVADNLDTCPTIYNPGQESWYCQN